MHTRTIIIGLTILVFGLLALGAWGSRETSAYWKNTTIACLPQGHTNLAFHFHPTISLIVDGEEEFVPENIGTASECMAEVHTHDASGVVHVEGVEQSRKDSFTLTDFFSVWGQSFEREGYTAEILVNGAPSPGHDPSALMLRDNMAIEVRYTSEGQGGVSREATIETRIDKGASALDVEVVPLAVLEDSRCPSGVECIQAGTVRIRALLSSGLGEVPQQVFELGKPITTEAEIVTLIHVEPEATTEGISLNSYRFIFRITKR
jgi:hypothetical protein